MRLPEKPPHGAPCNGCGLCCMFERCPLSLRLFGPGGACPALTHPRHGPGLDCGVIRDPGRYAPRVVSRHGPGDASKAAAALIGAGLGCDAQLEGEEYNTEWGARARAERDRMSRLGVTEWAFRIWFKEDRR